MSDFRVSFYNQKSASQILRFLYESGLLCHIEYTDECISMICKELKDGTINPIWLNCKSLETLRKRLESSDASSLLCETETEEWFVKRMKPNDHFKQYCGSEWLSKDGRISPEQAVEFLKYHIKCRKMNVSNGIIRADSWFQEVIQESKEEIYEGELNHIVKRFF